MADEDYGAWYIRGLEWDDPLRIRTPDELINWINELGFLPLFSNEVKGFSVAEHTWSSGWWTDDPAEDPWLWRAGFFILQLILHIFAGVALHGARSRPAPAARMQE